MDNDTFLQEMKEFLHGEHYNKKFKLKGGNSTWLQKETRINAFRILKYMWEEDQKRGRRKAYTAQQIYKAIGIDNRDCRHATYILSMAQKNPITMRAWQFYNKKAQTVEKNVVRFRLKIRRS